MNANELNERFGKPGIRFDVGNGGLTRATLSTRGSEAEVYLYGGHVTRFDKKGEKPVLFMSAQSLFKPGKAIRGGIPLIFPWFGPHPEDPKKSQHGFARTTEWNVASAEAKDDEAHLILRIESNDATRALWPHEFVATLLIKLSDRLTVSLDVANTSEQAFSYEAALHTYLTVGDIRRASVKGLEDTTYIDKTDGMKRKQQRGPVKIEKETDSVYINTAATCIVEDPTLRRSIVVEKSGSKSTVVWNPHAEKAKALADFGDEEWQRMICVETCNAADNAVRLPAGERHVTTTVISTRAA